MFTPDFIKNYDKNSNIGTPLVFDTEHPEYMPPLKKSN